MPSITDKRLRQIIAEEVMAAMEDQQNDQIKSLEQLPAISKAAIDFLKALNNFKEKCPADCLSSVTGLDQMESTLNDMAMNPGSYLSGPKKMLDTDVDSLHEPEEDEFEEEELEDDSEELEEK